MLQAHETLPALDAPRAARAADAPIDLDASLYERQTRLLGLLTRWCRVSIEGLDNLPDGPALLVSNHGQTSIDGALLIHSVFEHTGRILRGMGDRILFRTRASRWALHCGGVVEASMDNARVLLQAGQWVLNYPGGAREVMKSDEQNYQLSWEGRTGFARLALELGIPIVPVAGIGVDDLFVQLMDQEQVLKSRWGAWLQRRTGRDHVPPLWLGLGPIPLPGPVTFKVGKPLRFDGGPEAVQSPTAVRCVHSTVRSGLEHLIAEGLREREEAGQ